MHKKYEKRIYYSEFGGAMELFDDQTYEKLSEEYEKELGTPTSGFKRAMLGAKPFELRDSKEKRMGLTLLSFANSINVACAMV